MGYVYASSIRKAIEYLLPILQTEKWVNYSRFYDGTDECHARLSTSLQEDQSPELLMDLAVDQLVELGIVRRVDLDDKLSDEENDYRIELVVGAPTGSIEVRDMDL